MDILISLSLTFAATQVSGTFFHYRLPGLAVIGLYLLIYWLVERLRRRPLPPGPGRRA